MRTTTTTLAAALIVTFAAPALADEDGRFQRITFKAGGDVLVLQEDGSLTLDDGKKKIAGQATVDEMDAILGRYGFRHDSLKNMGHSNPFSFAKTDSGRAFKIEVKKKGKLLAYKFEGEANFPTANVSVTRLANALDGLVDRLKGGSVFANAKELEGTLRHEEELELPLKELTLRTADGERYFIDTNDSSAHGRNLFDAVVMLKASPVMKGPVKLRAIVEEREVPIDKFNPHTSPKTKIKVLHLVRPVEILPQQAKTPDGVRPPAGQTPPAPKPADKPAPKPADKPSQTRGVIGAVPE